MEQFREIIQLGWKKLFWSITFNSASWVIIALSKYLRRFQLIRLLRIIGNCKLLQVKWLYEWAFRWWRTGLVKPNSFLFIRTILHIFNWWENQRRATFSNKTRFRRFGNNEQRILKLLSWSSQNNFWLILDLKLDGYQQWIKIYWKKLN